MNAARPNEIWIYPKPWTLDIEPLFPSVKPGYDDLVVNVDWSKNNDFWARVVLGAFTLPNGKPCPQVEPREASIPKGDETPHTIKMKQKVVDKTECKFTVELHRTDPPERFLFDPGLNLNPGP